MKNMMLVFKAFFYILYNVIEGAAHCVTKAFRAMFCFKHCFPNLEYNSLENKVHKNLKFRDDVEIKQNLGRKNVLCSHSNQADFYM